MAGYEVGVVLMMWACGCVAERVMVAPAARPPPLLARFPPLHIRNAREAPKRGRQWCRAASGVMEAACYQQDDVQHILV